MSDTKWTVADVERLGESRQAYFRDWQKRAARAAADDRAAQRRARRQCKWCFYVGVMAGQAFTEYTCKGCREQHMHANTNVPTLCDACADRLNACVHCGGEREWKEPPAPSPAACPAASARQKRSRRT